MVILDGFFYDFYDIVLLCFTHIYGVPISSPELERSRAAKVPLLNYLRDILGNEDVIVTVCTRSWTMV